MNQHQSFHVKRAYLYALITSVGLSALLGINAILSGRFDWAQLRIILTTVTIAAASICGMACTACLDSKRAQIIPLAGIAFTLLGAVLIIAGMWIEVDSETYWSLAASVSVFSVACAHLALLSLARLAEPFQWSIVAAHVAIFGLASLIVYTIFAGRVDSGRVQLLSVAAIFDAAISVLIPIFHRLSKAEVAVTRKGQPAPVPSDVDAEMAMLQQRMHELERLKHQGQSN